MTDDLHQVDLCEEHKIKCKMKECELKFWSNKVLYPERFDLHFAFVFVFPVSTVSDHFDFFQMSLHIVSTKMSKRRLEFCCKQANDYLFVSTLFASLKKRNLRISWLRRIGFPKLHFLKIYFSLFLFVELDNQSLFHNSLLLFAFSIDNDIFAWFRFFLGFWRNFKLIFQ